MLIYRVTNKINSKSYIGQTTCTLKKRIRGHLRRVKEKSNHPFYNALNRYGCENFSWEVLSKSAKTRERLNSLEIFYIKKFNTVAPNGYNISPGGYGNGGLTKGMKFGPCPEERKRRISKAKLGISLGPRSEEDKAKMRKPHGPMSEDRKAKLRKIRIGKTYEEIFGVEKAKAVKEKTRMSKLKHPYRHSKESKEKISKAKLGKKLGPWSEKQRTAMSKRLLGHVTPQSTKEKIRKSVKKSWILRRQRDGKNERQ